MTRDNYFNLRLNKKDIAKLKTASTVALAGKIGDTWYSEELELEGFGAAYAEMCGE